MKGCSDTVTIWHKERIDGKDVFTRQILPVSCKWNEDIIRDVSDGRAHIASAFNVIVPEYTGFECSVGDIMALGAHEIEITGEKGNTASDLKTSLSPHIFTVRAIRDNTRLRLGKHIKAEGSLLNEKSLKLMDDGIVSLSEQLEKIKQDNAYLFED